MKIALFIIAQITISQLVKYFASGLPEHPINWPISLAWGSMMILPLVLTTYHYLKTGKHSQFSAVFLCASAWILGYPTHFDAAGNFAGFYLPTNIAVYAAFACVLYTLDQKWSAAIGWVFAGFGVSLIPFYGMTFEPGEAFYERLVLCILVALQYIQPSVEAIGRHNDPAKEALNVSRQQRDDFKKAA